MMKAFWTGLAVGAFISAPALAFGGKDEAPEAAPATAQSVVCEALFETSPAFPSKAPCPSED